MSTSHYQKTAREVLKEFKVSISGLSNSEADKKLVKFGKNEIVSKKKFNILLVFLMQFKSSLIFILLVAIFFSVIIGEYIDAIAIGIIVLLNALLGFFQDFKAERSFEALKKYNVKKARVRRDNEVKLIDSIFLVPGDIILLEKGEKVPADSRILFSAHLEVDESLLTGESVPVSKNADKIYKKVVYADQKNTVFSNTIVTRGSCEAIVIGTGENTVLGEISGFLGEIEEDQAPLVKKLDQLGKDIGKIIVIITILVFIIGIISGRDSKETFLLAVALAVSAIPEGLPAVITISFALGVQELAKGKALIRKLSAVETLGSTTVICSDKTGTLTKNELTVKNIATINEEFSVSGSGFNARGEILSQGQRVNLEKQKSLSMLLRTGILCNSSFLGKNNEVIGDPTEVALIALGKKARLEKKLFKENLIFSFEFDSDRKRMSSIYKVGKKAVSYTKGALEKVLEKSTHFYDNGKTKPLNKYWRERILSHEKEYARKGLRVLGFAFKELGLKKKYLLGESEKNMIFLGMAGMIDTARDESAEAIAICQNARIQVKMITGDHLLTAKAIAKELGLNHFENVFTGEELEKISVDKLAKKIEKSSVFARVNPFHKVKIVKALKKNGHIVAMTGDGVNDAPALKEADIGVAMGSGTDVSKGAAEMVILDDNFSTIVNSVKLGRQIYANIKNFVRYILSANFGEIIIIFVAIFMGFPLPLLPLQILWVNLLTDSLPPLALSKEVPSKSIMNSKPRNPKENIFREALSFILIAALVSATFSLVIFVFIGNGLSEPNLSYAQTMILTFLIFFELVLVFNCRQEGKSILEIPLFSNKYLWGAVLISTILQLGVVYLPFFNKLLKTVPLSPVDLGIIILLSLSAILVPYLDRLYKFFKAKFISKNQEVNYLVDFS